MSVDHGAAAAGPRRHPKTTGAEPRYSSSSEICIWSHHASGQLAGGVQLKEFKAGRALLHPARTPLPLAQDPQTHAELPILGQSSPHRKRQASAAALS